MWRAVRTEEGSDEFVILLHVLGLAVRADDGGVAADDLDNNCDDMHWSAEVEEAAPLRPDLALAEAAGHEDDDDGAAAENEAEDAVDGNGGGVVGDGGADQREAAYLYDRLDKLYMHMDMLCEEARGHHQAIKDIDEEAKATGDWSRVKKDLRPHNQALERIERSYEYQVSSAAQLRLELVRLGFPPLEEPAGLSNPNQLRR